MPDPRMADHDPDFESAQAQRIYIDALRRMTPEQRLARAFDLTEFTRVLLMAGIANDLPELSDAERHAIFLDRLSTCHNTNY